MLAIIETGGRQHKVSVGQKISVDKLSKKVNDVWQELQAGETVTFDKVLVYSSQEEGKEAQVGKPTLSGATVTAKVVAQEKDKKVLPYKQFQRHGYRRKRGHRQPWTVVEITEIKVA